MDGKIFHKECFKKQFASSGGKYGGQKVTAGRTISAPGGAGADAAASEATPASPKAAEKKAAAEAEAAKAKADADAKAAANVKAAADKAAADAKAAADKAAADKAAADAKAASEVKASAPAPKAAVPASKAAGKAPASKPWTGVRNDVDRKTIFVEQIDKQQAKEIKEPVRVESTYQETVYVGNIDASLNQVIVQIDNKCKAITISGCQNVGVVCTDVVARIEIVNCKKRQEDGGAFGLVHLDDWAHALNLYL